jgi:hypothetical protein
MREPVGYPWHSTRLATVAIDLRESPKWRWRENGVAEVFWAADRFPLPIKLRRIASEVPSHGNHTSQADPATSRLLGI